MGGVLMKEHLLESKVYDNLKYKQSHLEWCIIYDELISLYHTITTFLNETNNQNDGEIQHSYQKEYSDIVLLIKRTKQTLKIDNFINGDVEVFDKYLKYVKQKLLMIINYLIPSIYEATNDIVVLTDGYAMNKSYCNIKRNLDIVKRNRLH